jgi:hypothetical protein
VVVVGTASEPLKECACPFFFFLARRPSVVAGLHDGSLPEPVAKIAVPPVFLSTLMTSPTRLEQLLRVL